MKANVFQFLFDPDWAAVLLIISMPVNRFFSFVRNRLLEINLFAAEVTLGCVAIQTLHLFD